MAAIFRFTPAPGRCRAHVAALAAVVLVWLLALVAGTLLMIYYDVRPGDLGQAVDAWPADSRLVRSTTQPTLVMFIHPRCPCSRASIAELARIMERRTTPIDARVIFVKPPGTPEDWSRTSLRRAAEQIPGVQIAVDPLGAESRAFGAATSGQTLLYDAAGRLAFRGGITSGRGHQGANLASDALLAQLDAASDAPPTAPTHPVFGCSLLTPPDQCRKPQP